MSSSSSYTLQKSENLEISSIDSKHSDWQWEPIQLISSESSSISRQPSPYIDIKGNIHVVWGDYSNYDSAGSDSDIFYKQWDFITQSWSLTEVLTPESDLVSQAPDIFVDIAGNRHVIWSDFYDYTGTSGSDNDICYKKWNVFLQNWETTQLLSVDSTDFCFNPKIVVDTLGNIHTAWKDYTSKQDIHYRRWNNISQSWTPTEIVSSESSGIVSSEFATCIDSWNNLHITYSDNTDILGAGMDYDLFYKRWDFITSGWTSIELVTGESNMNAYSPCIDTDSKGNVHIGWKDSTDHNAAGIDDDILYTYRDNSTSSWSPLEVISWTSSATSQAPDLKVDHNDLVHIVWEDLANTDMLGSDFDIFYTTVKRDLSTSMTVVSSISNLSSSAPEICVDDSNYLNVIWSDLANIVNSGSDADIVYRRLSGPLEAPILEPLVPNPTETSGIFLGWTSIQGATRYHIYRTNHFLTELDSGIPILTVSFNSTFYALPDVGYHYFVVVADNGFYNSTFSNCVYVHYQLPQLREFTIFSILISFAALILVFVSRFRKRKK